VGVRTTRWAAYHASAGSGSEGDEAPGFPPRLHDVIADNRAIALIARVRDTAGN
jgi:hypothetical protein